MSDQKNLNELHQNIGIKCLLILSSLILVSVALNVNIKLKNVNGRVDRQVSITSKADSRIPRNAGKLFSSPTHQHSSPPPPMFECIMADGLFIL